MRRLKNTPYGDQEAVLAEIKELLGAAGIASEITQDSIYPYADELLKKGPVLVACRVPPWVPVNLRCGPRGGRPPGFKSWRAPILRTVMAFRRNGIGMELVVYLAARNDEAGRLYYAGNVPLQIVDLVEPGSFERLEEELARWTLRPSGAGDTP